MIAFWAVIILLIVLVVRGTGGRRAEHSAPATGSALQILQERFARGEIDRNEYQERRKILVG